MLAPLAILLTAAAPPAGDAAAPAKPLPQPSAVCQAWGPKPPACVEPPIRERLRIYGTWRDADSGHPADAVMIRRPAMIARHDEPLEGVAFPPFLRRGEERTSAQVTLELIIGTDGTITSCTPVRTKAWSFAPGAPRQSDLTPPAGLERETCAAVQAQRKFRPAIDASGRAIEAPTSVLVDYARERYELLASPAPPPPSQWLGRAPYDRSSAWPPHSYLSEGVRFTAPKFKDFLIHRNNLPKTALTGVVLDFAADGRALGCQVKQSSGDARLDAAACAALMTVRNTPTRWQVRGLPVEVSWKGDKARLTLPAAAVLPRLAAPIAIPAADVPGGNRPQNSGAAAGATQ